MSRPTLPPTTLPFTNGVTRHPATLASARRRHDLDTLRVGVFALLILYHVGMGYVAGWPWHVKSEHALEWLQAPMMAVNRWRMPLLFLISGAALGLVGIRAAGWAFCRERIIRLAVPLLFAMVAVIPVQAWCQAVFNGAWNGSFADFLVAYFSFVPWPAGAFDGSDVGVTWNHLWYLVYLLGYTLLLAALMPLLRHAGIGIAMNWLARRGIGAWILALAAVPTLSALLLADAWPPANNFFADWYQHGVYFPVFLFGYLIARHDGFWAAVLTARLPLTLAAIVAGALHFAALEAGGGQPDAALKALIRVSRMGYMACAMFAILGWARHLLDRPFRWLPRATEALFPWYILHQSLIVLAIFLLAGSGLPAPAEVSIVLLVTVAGCAIGTEIIRQVSWLRPLFGLKARPAPSPDLAAAMKPM